MEQRATPPISALTSRIPGAPDQILKRVSLTDAQDAPLKNDLQSARCHDERLPRIRSHGRCGSERAICDCEPHCEQDFRHEEVVIRE